MKQIHMSKLERLSMKLTNWIGTPVSIVIHTLFFIGIFAFVPLGLGLDQVLLILTTAVSLEAIYLAIFIQMTVNRTTASLEEVEEDIEDIQQDVEEIETDVEELSEDAKSEISSESEIVQALRNIDTKLHNLQKDIDTLKQKGIL
jgi:septal ring factor EnvC (AmiA/AmiB activator)